MNSFFVCVNCISNFTPVLMDCFLKENENGSRSEASSFVRRETRDKEREKYIDTEGYIYSYTHNVMNV